MEPNTTEKLSNQDDALLTFINNVIIEICTTKITVSRAIILQNIVKQQGSCWQELIQHLESLTNVSDINKVVHQHWIITINALVSSTNFYQWVIASGNPIRYAYKIKDTNK